MKKNSKNLKGKTLTYHFSWFCFLLLCFLVSLGASWVLLAKINFSYPALYDYAGISENIESYAPHNRYKPNFIKTTREQRLELFGGIVQSIQHQGKGLSKLAYEVDGQQKINLLTKAEIVHLQDVANLYHTMKHIIIFSFIILFSLFMVQIKRQIPLPKTITLLRYTLVVPLTLGLVLIIGAEKIFYKLHVLIFPEGHQWFFYYEESLMSTMMKAPDLFGYIAVMLVLLSIIFTVLLLRLYKVFVK